MVINPRMTQKTCLEGQVFSVPLIQPDLRREEAVHQIADALLYLETISTDIFKRQAQNHTHIVLHMWNPHSKPRYATCCRTEFSICCFINRERVFVTSVKQWNLFTEMCCQHNIWKDDGTVSGGLISVPIYNTRTSSLLHANHKKLNYKWQNSLQITKKYKKNCKKVCNYLINVFLKCGLQSNTDSCVLLYIVLCNMVSVMFSFVSEYLHERWCLCVCGSQGVWQCRKEPPPASGHHWPDQTSSGPCGQD